MTHDDKLSDRLRDELRRYNDPPELAQADLDAMWPRVEASLGGADRAGGGLLRDESGRNATRRWYAPRNLLPIAAVLLVGVAIGRLTAHRGAETPVRLVSVRDSLQIPEPYQHTTSQYLGQTAALLATLPADARVGASDEFVGRAHDLLLTTRLLLDSPAANDPRVQALLDDLELVLAQIIRLQTEDGRTELELIRMALEQRDVLPRLRTVVANISAD